MLDPCIFPFSLLLTLRARACAVISSEFSTSLTHIHEKYEKCISFMLCVCVCSANSCVASKQNTVFVLDSVYCVELLVVFNVDGLLGHLASDVYNVIPIFRM